MHIMSLKYIYMKYSLLLYIIRNIWLFFLWKVWIINKFCLSSTDFGRRICQDWIYLLFQMAGQIDMNMQSDLMAAFEESL